MAKHSEAEKLRRQVKALQKRGYLFPKGFVPKPGMDLYAESKYILQSTDTVITGTERRKMERSIAAKRAAVTRRANRLASEILEQEGAPGYSPPDAVKLTLKHVRDLIDNWKAKDIWTPKKARKKDFVAVKQSDRDKLKALLDQEIAVRGERNVAIALEEKSERVNDLVMMILYGGSGYSEDGGRYMQGELTELAGIIRGHALNTEEAKDIEQLVEQYMPA